MTREERMEQMRNCKHCFAKIEDGYYFGDVFRSSRNECILCGASNRNRQRESIFYAQYNQEYSPEYEYYFAELPMAVDNYPKLSDEKIGTEFPYLIYQSARKLDIVPEYDGTEMNNQAIALVLAVCGVITEMNNLDLETDEGLELLFMYYNEGKLYKKTIK